MDRTLNDEPLYQRVADELRTDGPREGLWLKAVTEADGEEKKAKILYVKWRVAEMKDAGEGVWQHRPEWKPHHNASPAPAPADFSKDVGSADEEAGGPRDALASLLQVFVCLAGGVLIVLEPAAWDAIVILGLILISIVNLWLAKAGFREMWFIGCVLAVMSVIMHARHEGSAGVPFPSSDIGRLAGQLFGVVVAGLIYAILTIAIAATLRAAGRTLRRVLKWGRN